MESAIQTMVKVFLKSTKGKESLGKKEFQHLVKNQLSNILSDTDSKEAVNNMGQGLDADHDGKVGFEEYMKLVGYLACSLSEQRALSKEEPKQNADGAPETQVAQDKAEPKPEANAEAKVEAKPEAAAGVKVEVPDLKLEANAEPKVEVKLDANAAPKVDVKLDADAGPKLEVKAEGAAEPEAPKADEEKTAAATVAAAVEAAASTVEEVVKEGEKETEKVVEEAVEKVAEAAEEVEKKTEEATS